MRCPFGYGPPPKRRQNYTFGVDPGFVDYVERMEDEEEQEYWRKRNAFDAKYPTCWRRFLHAIGIEGTKP